ncbi:MAG: beta-galactosidase [Planctomycetaceae bacterium]|jgi:hypothetical protein|nr:beta-galactosidase [Planctomycetaceae bacterium]
MRPFIIVIFFLAAVTFSRGGGVVLFDAETKLDSLHKQSATLSINDVGGVLVVTDADGHWPGFNMGERNWNLAGCDSIVIDVTNLGGEPINLNCRLDSPDIDFASMRGTFTYSVTVAANETKQCEIKLPPLVPMQLVGKLFAMRGGPGGIHLSGTDTKPGFHKDAVVGLVLFLNNPKRETRWCVRKISAVASDNGNTNTEQAAWFTMPPEQFFPMIDEFGQFKHSDWVGKVHSDDELKQNAALEAADIAKQPSPYNRDKYGGCTAAGPKRNATGHFRVEKVDGVWWFVDPIGYLFWSHGTNCVGSGNAVTPITDREFYFANLPPRGDARFESCYGQGNWAPHNYYEGKGTYTTFNFTKSNLIRKYGGDWQNRFIEQTHARLKSWGMNTIANWSEPRIYEARKTPYTATMGTGGRYIAGSSGYWGHFPDPFAKEFVDLVTKNAARLAASTADDAWCLGYFVDNEISWGGERSLAIAACVSPADQPAKIVFVDGLKAKYGDVAKLNELWGTSYSDWNSLLNSSEKPNENKAKDDLDKFHQQICEQYFKTIHDSLKKVAPNKLYLGCRFAWANETAVRAAAKYCDVISYNIYNKTPSELKLPDGVDKPVVIGEFHFGALDRGMFHTGLVPTKSQVDRAKHYENYVRDALNHKQIIGTHWFQYGDQATTGRGDGENYQIGLTTVTDTPYKETIRAIRRVGYPMYEIRLKVK